MPDLYSQLKDLRRKLAEQEAVEVFRVFQNVTIDEICAKLPKNEEELLDVKGMGEKKVGRYGKVILEIVNGASDKQGNDGDTEISNSQFLISNENAPSLSRGEISPPEGESKSAYRVGGREEGASRTWGEEKYNPHGKQEVTVSQYLDYLNLVFQRSADVKVVGEVSGGKMYPSGFYFTLKDKTDETALSCYLPTYTYKGLGILVEDGMEVAVEGMPRMVKRNGRFQFAVENLELVGEGALKKAYDLLKAKLQEEGLFDRKRELPEFVTSVGVITSRAGAVIHDFRNNLARLGIKVYLKDVRVEGASSPGMVVDAIKYFNELSLRGGQPAEKQSGLDNTDEIAASLRRLAPRNDRKVPDVIVIMRGGGSMEDLQGFNNEQVVRAVFGSKIPTIVSIGHDKDVPLAQLAADVMVSTPTAAAHAVSATWNRLVEDLPSLESQLVYTYSEVLAQTASQLTLHMSALNNWCNRLSQSYRRLQEILFASVDRYIEWIDVQRKELSGHIRHISQIQENSYEQVAARVTAASSFLEQANPERQLKLGYAIVKNKAGKLIRSKKEVRVGETLHTQVADGDISSTVT